MKHNITFNSYHTFNITIELSSTNPLNVTIQCQPRWLSQCEKTFGFHNLTSTFIIIATWQRHCCMLHHDIYFDVRHNSTSTSWMSQCHANFDDVAMWHYLLWILKCDINFHECRNLTFININFDGYHNVTSTMMNVAMWHQLCWMLQCDINLDKCHNLTKTLFFVSFWHILWCMLHIENRSWIISCDIMFEVSCNVAYPYFYVTIDAT